MAVHCHWTVCSQLSWLSLPCTLLSLSPVPASSRTQAKSLMRWWPQRLCPVSLLGVVIWWVQSFFFWRSLPGPLKEEGRVWSGSSCKHSHATPRQDRRGDGVWWESRSLQGMTQPQGWRVGFTLYLYLNSLNKANYWHDCYLDMLQETTLCCFGGIYVHWNHNL